MQVDPNSQVASASELKQFAEITLLHPWIVGKRSLDQMYHRHKFMNSAHRRVPPSTLGQSVDCGAGNEQIAYFESESDVNIVADRCKDI